MARRMAASMDRLVSGQDGAYDRPDRRDLDEGLGASAILAALPDGMIVTDDKGAVRIANAAAGTLLGCDPEVVVGQPASAVLSLLSDEGRPIAWEAPLLERVLRGEQVEPIHGVLAGHDGGRVQVEVAAFPLVGEPVDSRGAVVMIRRDRSQNLRKATDALSQSQKMQAIGLLTGGVAHDFNNVLAVIRSGVDLLQRDDLSESRRARYVNAIGEAADRGAALTGQLLAFARQQPLQTGTFDAHAVLQHLSQVLRAMAGPGVRVSLEAERTPCWVIASVSPFETAIINLAANARDAMGGEGEIRIFLRQAEAAAGADGEVRPGDFIAVVVEDTGAGIAPDVVDQIFEPFYTTKPIGRGTGLGLSQVHAFAREAGGEVRVDSRPGEGARFTLFLPRGDAVELPAPLASEAHQPPGAVLRILMVEDDERVAETSAQLLTSLGFLPTIVTSPEAALEILDLRRGEFDLMLTDVVMPGPIDGLQLARTVKSRWADLPVVLTTGATEFLLDMGGDYAVLPKPFSADLLRKVLRQASSA